MYPKLLGDSPRKVFILRHASMPCPQLMVMLALSCDTSVVLVLHSTPRHYRYQVYNTERARRALLLLCSAMCPRAYAHVRNARCCHSHHYSTAVCACGTYFGSASRPRGHLCRRRPRLRHHMHGSPPP